MGIEEHHTESWNCNIQSGKHLLDGLPHQGILFQILKTTQREGAGEERVGKLCSRGEPGRSFLGCWGQHPTPVQYLQGGGKVSDGMARGCWQASRPWGPQAMVPFAETNIRQVRVSSFRAAGDSDRSMWSGYWELKTKGLS